METRRSGALTGSGRNSSALTSEKIAVFAPMPSAIDRIATALTMGAVTSDRQARRKSCMRTFGRYYLAETGRDQGIGLSVDGPGVSSDEARKKRIISQRPTGVHETLQRFSLP